MKSGSVASKLRYGAMAPMGTVYHSILREIGFKKNLSSRVVRTECARRNGWALKSENEELRARIRELEGCHGRRRFRKKAKLESGERGVACSVSP